MLSLSRKSIKFSPLGYLRRLSTKPNTVRAQLLRLKELVDAVSTVNSSVEKQAIIGHYPDLRQILERISHPRFRTHLSYATLAKHLSSGASTPMPVAPTDLMQLLDELGAQKYTGNELKAVVGSFLANHGLLDVESKGLLALFGRLLDRNLAAGFGDRTLKGVSWANTTEKTPQPVSEKGPRTSHAQEFSPALGKTIEAPFRELAKHPKWYISRKLDGYPQLRSLLERDPEVVEKTADGIVKRLVLDGEVCVMRERKGSSELIEDFPSTVSEIRRGSGWTIDHPAYFVFDVISWGEVSAGKSLKAPLGRSFGERIADIKQLVDWLDQNTEGLVKNLPQWEMQNLAQVDEMVGRAVEEGWEGLIFRVDKPYRGGRSTDIRKFKQWQDAEYVVNSLDTGVMRLPMDGIFGMHEACANIWIEHKGTPVSVGSGLTVEQRLRYARDPKEIIGKQVTVEYFSESEAAGRPGAKSLRFPRIKQVWDGLRDV